MVPGFCRGSVCKEAHVVVSAHATVQAVWDLRAHPAMSTIFTAVYSDLRGKPVRDFATSLDAVNLRPPVRPYHDEDTPDWAHLDLGR